MNGYRAVAEVRSYWNLLKSSRARSVRPKQEAVVSTADETSTEVHRTTARPAVTKSLLAAPGDASPPLGRPQIRPVGPNMGDAWESMGVTLQSVTEALNGPAGDELCRYFRNYPASSIMGDRSRAMLFVLIRMLRPRAAAEIGTYFAGGAEVIARALWENGNGMLHTTDPFGTDRCPAILAAWPAELRSLVKFYPLNSMEFLIKLHHQGLALDFVLIDGDHDYEPALFDLQMAARLLRPGGVIVLNDSVQTGPFQAARTFLAANPAWRELGTAVSAYDENSPFAGERMSQPGTGFVVLQAPDHWSVNATPRSWGQATTDLSFADGLSFDVPPQVTAGTLHYQAILRLFGAGAPLEVKRTGFIAMSFDGTATTLVHKLEKPLKLDAPGSADDTRCTFEIELCWCADTGCPPLALASIPVPRATI